VYGEETMEDQGVPGTYHVLPAAHGGWMVKRDGAATAIGHFAGQEEALTCARSLAAGDAERLGGLSGVREPCVVVHESLRYAWATSDDGKVMRVENFSNPRRQPQFGSARGKITMAEDFGETPSDFTEYL
jgi:Uncharacterized protein conserved in bacteria (DUF2188)